MIKSCLDCGKEFKVLRYFAQTNYCKNCKIIGSAKRWRIRHPKRAREVFHNYRLRNLELCRKRTRENQIILNDRKRFGGFRSQAIKRDNYTCQKCGKDVSGKKMAAIHHINHDHCDNRLENFKTLCNHCHALYHNKFRERNKLGQFQS